MSVIPFRRTKRPPPPPKEEPKKSEHCPRCGWTMPGEMRADPGAVKGKQLLLYIDCPECGAELILLVEFEK